MKFKVVSRLGISYDCYGFVSGGDGRIYGVCYKPGDVSFTLIRYDDLRPFIQ